MRSRYAGTLTVLLALLFALPAAGRCDDPPPAGDPFDLQAAITHASEGDTIIVPAGTYGPVVVNKKGLTIDGSAGAVIAVTGETDGVLVSADNVTLIGLTITGDLQSYGINATGVAGLTVTGCTVTNHSGGLFLFGVDSLVVAGNEVSGNRFQGIRVANCTGASVSANTVVGNGFANISGAEDAGVALYYAHGSEVLGNVMTSNGGAAVFAFDVQGATIANNTMLRNGYGAWIDSSRACTASANVIKESSYDGIRLTLGTTWCLVSGNTIEGNGLLGKTDDRLVAGIRITWDALSEEPDCVDNWIEGNTALGNYKVDARDESGHAVRKIRNTWVGNTLGTVRPNKLD